MPIFGIETKLKNFVDTFGYLAYEGECNFPLNTGFYTKNKNRFF